MVIGKLKSQMSTNNIKTSENESASGNEQKKLEDNSNMTNINTNDQLV